MKIKFILNYIWSALISFSMPFAIGLIYMDITGHSKGYSYNLGEDADISIIFGIIELVIWLAISIPSFVYIFCVYIQKIKQKRCKIHNYNDCYFCCFVCFRRIYNGWLERISLCF